MTFPGMPTRRLDRAEIATAEFPPVFDRKPRPVAHVLTIFGLTVDGPTYSFECRADARDLGKICAAWGQCECDTGKGPEPPDEDAICPKSPTRRHKLIDGFLCRPFYGCVFAYADAEETDDAVKELAHGQELTRGQYLVKATLDLLETDVELELLGEVRNVVGAMPTPEACSVRPTRLMRYPGYGPEVELRELIEEALAEKSAEAVVWDDDHAEIVVDANRAAKRVLAWIEDRYDIPHDQRTLPLLARTPADEVRPPGYTTPRIATVHPIGDRL